MARKEVFEAAAVKPTGTMPEGASPPAEKGEAETEAETEADAKQNPKEKAAAAANGADEQEQKKSPRNAGSLQDDATRLHSEPSGVMGDTGSEYARETPGISMIPGIGEAECEALSSDATLRELVQLWSTLDPSVQRAILTIARQSK